MAWGNSTHCTDNPASASLLDLQYNLSLGSADNGNVTSISNRRDGTRSQNFTYDALNRIASAYTASTYATSPQHCWSEKYGFDGNTAGSGLGAWGNLTGIQSVSSDYSGCASELLGIGISGLNQINTSGYVYDAAGNLTNVPAPGAATYTYDAENRMKTTAGITYTYDGDGNRVEKSSGKLYWYGGSGEVLDETDLQGHTNNSTFQEYIFFTGKRIAKRDSSSVVNYYLADHLGTARVVTDAVGTAPPLDESDFYPFGGERPVTGPSSGNNYKFTGKERDAESGLDMFGARYYGSSLGRFMTPDWAAKPITVPYANFGNPQSLNLYSYVENNPLTLVDTDGHDIIYAAGLQNAQLVKDTVQAILADPHTSGSLSGYVGKDNPDLTIKSGDLSGLDEKGSDGGVTATVQGATVPDIQTSTSSSTDVNGVTTTSAPETILTGATITIDNRTSKGDTPGVMVHESVHAGEAKADPARFSKDAAAEKSLPHDQRPQEQRANAAQKAYGPEIKQAVKQIEKDRKKDPNQ